MIRGEALWTEGVGVGAPDGFGVMDGVGRDGEDGAWDEGMAGEGDGGAGRDETREAEGGGGVDAEGFVDDVVEAGGRFVSGVSREEGEGSGRTREDLSRFQSPVYAFLPGGRCLTLPGAS